MSEHLRRFWLLSSLRRDSNMTANTEVVTTTVPEFDNATASTARLDAVDGAAATEYNHAFFESDLRICARRLLILADAYSAGVGGNSERPQIARNAITETVRLGQSLRDLAEKWDLPFPGVPTRT